jgi:hypothetical protein
MAKLALKNREAKRAKQVAKYAAKRAELLAIINNARLGDEERMAARLKFQQLPRNASPVRQQSLRTDRTSAGLLPQVRPVPQQVARSGHARGSARHDQGQLVRGDRE